MTAEQSQHCEGCGMQNTPLSRLPQRLCAACLHGMARNVGGPRWNVHAAPAWEGAAVFTMLLLAAFAAGFYLGCVWCSR